MIAAAQAVTAGLRAGLAPGLAGFVALAFAALPTEAQNPFPGIIGADDREIVDSWERPWNAVGKINTPAWRRIGECTGTLIAPEIVVTAAHCLFNRVSGKPFRNADIHFSAGLRRDRRIGYSAARCVRFAEGYRFDKRTGAEAIARDYAFIVLANAIGTEPVGLLPPGDLKPGLSATHAGYGRDRRFLLVAHRGCTITAISGNRLVNDCDSNHGQSGGPLLVERGGDLVLAGVMSAAVPGQANQAAGIAATADQLEAIRTCR